MASSCTDCIGEALIGKNNPCNVCVSTLVCAEKSWDVYAVAATLAHLASGKRPFSGVNSRLIALEHIHGRALEQRHLEDVPEPIRYTDAVDLCTSAEALTELTFSPHTPSQVRPDQVPRPRPVQAPDNRGAVRGAARLGAGCEVRGCGGRGCLQ